jgi:hypothetical protein
MNTRQTLQRACYDAYWKIVEVETRERGWNAADADAAKKGFNAALLEYVNTFGEPPEYEANPTDHRFRFPLAVATRAEP